MSQSRDQDRVYPRKHDGVSHHSPVSHLYESRANLSTQLTIKYKNAKICSDLKSTMVNALLVDNFICPLVSCCTAALLTPGVTEDGIPSERGTWNQDLISSDTCVEELNSIRFYNLYPSRASVSLSGGQQAPC